MRLTRCSSVVPLYVLLFAGSGITHAAQPWDAPFGGDPQAIIKAATSVHAADDAQVQILLDDRQFSIDKSGRMRSTFRRVYKVISQDAVEDWANIEQAYDPWHQQKPVLRARVIAADGAVHWLDQKTIADAPVVQFDSTIFSDRRTVRAPLPAIVPGAIVESEIAEDETPALSQSGVSRRIAVERYVALERLHLKIEVANNIPLHTIYRLIADSAVKRAEHKATTEIECDIGPFTARKEFEFNLPPDVYTEPWFGFSTGKSWQALAVEYSALVEKQIEGADVKMLLAGVDEKAQAAAKIARIATNLHQSIRYTGVEFRDAAIIPAAPAEVLRRGYGDCKDKSSLLVAALRAAGMRANVALLASGFGADVEPELPGLDIFDHVIVRVDAVPPVWIDATAADARIGTLPDADQGRKALIASPTTTALVRTPEQPDAWERHALEIRFSDFGPSTITETITASGPAESALRAQYGGDEQKTKTALENYAKRVFAGKALGKFSRSGGKDLGTPFTVSVEILQTPQAMTTMDSALVQLTPALVMKDLPFSLTGKWDSDDAKEKKRERDFLFPAPQRVEYRFHLIPPTLFKAGKVPASESMNLGSVEYSRTVKSNADSTIDVDFALKVPKRRITAAEFMATRESIEKLLGKGLEPITFVPATAEFLALGETSKAIRMLKDHVEQHASDATAHIRFANALLSAGLGDAARAEAQKATEVDPKSAVAWQTLGWTMEHDSFGRPTQGNWSQPEAEKGWRKAMELEPDNILFSAGLAEVLGYNAQGFLLGSGSRLKEAIALYREILKRQPNPPAESALTITLVYDNQLDAAREEARKCTDEQRQLMNAVITTLQEGSARAIVNAQGDVPDASSRARVLAQTAFEMLRLRRYDDARTLLAAAGRALPSAPIGSYVERLKPLKRHEVAMLPASDPRSPVQKLILAQMRGHPTGDEFSALFVSRVDLKQWSSLSREAKAAVWLAGRNYGPQGLSDEVLTDFAISRATFEKEGDDEHGYRITEAGDALVTFRPVYVVRENGAYKILGSADRAGNIARLILRLVDQNQIANAQWWLDKLVPDLPSDDISLGLPAPKGLWSGMKPELRGPAAIRIAAASILARSIPDPAAIKILEQAQVKATNPLDKAQLDYALCEAFHRSANWPSLMAISRRLMDSRFFAWEGFRYFTEAATELKSWSELAQVAQKRVDAPRSAPNSLKVLIVAKQQLGANAIRPRIIKGT